jgi:rRNA maturation protein Nop10
MSVIPFKTSHGLTMSAPRICYDFTNRPACPNCGRSMHRMHIRLGADGFPELGTFRCGECGVSVTKAASDQFDQPNRYSRS